MNMLFNTRDESKIISCDQNIPKPMRICVDIHETNKKFTVTVEPKNACKLKFADHLWLPFLDQPQSDIVVFVIINFRIYHDRILDILWKKSSV